MRKKRTITKEEKQMFLSLKPDDINLMKFEELFVDVVDTTNIERDISSGKFHPTIKRSKFNTFDEFVLEKGEYFNTERITTNCGLFIFNKFLIEPDFQKIVGYVNFEITKKGLSKIDDKIMTALLLDESGDISRAYINYLNRLCWFAFALHTQICASLNLRTIEPLPEVTALKKKLLKENKKAIENNDVVTYVDIQNQLVAKAEECLENDPAIELYLSGARGSMDNAYRQWLCTKGPIWNESTGKFDIVTNSLYEGMPKDSLPALANAIVNSFYTKSIAPGESGYITKQLSAAYQDVVLDDPGSDCGAMSMPIELTKYNVNLYLYNFIETSKGKFTRLEPGNRDNYIGKTVNLRVADFCIGDKLCNRCAGDRFYLMGLQNAGLTFGRISNSMLRAKFKTSHDSTVRISQLTPEEIFVPLQNK